MICHNYRRAPAVMLAKQIIDEGQLGEIRHFRGTYLQDWIADPNVSAASGGSTRSRPAPARSATSPHTSIDLARFLVGEITEVSADLRDVHQGASAARTIRRRRAA